MAEAPPPAGGEAGERGAPVVDEQQQGRQAQDQQREDEQRRHGEPGQRPQHQRQAAPPPAMRGLQAPHGARQKPHGISHACSFSLSGDGAGRLRTLTRFTRRGSASRTSKVMPEGWAISSPRLGTRSARCTTSPPTVSISASRSSGVRMGPTCCSSSSIVARPSAVSGAVGARDQLRADGDVVLVLDLADDLLDQILDGDEAVDAAELVDDEDEMLARQAHLQQQVEDAHGGCHEEDLAQIRLQIEGRVFDAGTAGPRRQQILDVDEADDIVEGFAIDRQARMAMGAELAQQVFIADVLGHGGDVGARNHDIAGGNIAQPDDVAQQAALARGDRLVVMAAVALRLGLLDDLLEHVAQRLFAIAPPALQPEPAAPAPRR